jgi:hypothetical protein
MPRLSSLLSQPLPRLDGVIAPFPKPPNLFRQSLANHRDTEAQRMHGAEWRRPSPFPVHLLGLGVSGVRLGGPLPTNQLRENVQHVRILVPTPRYGRGSPCRIDRRGLPRHLETRPARLVSPLRARSLDRAAVGARPEGGRFQTARVVHDASSACANGKITGFAKRW